jgi:thioredoxin reductase
MQGVTFGAAGSFVRWGPEGERAGTLPLATPAGATVPLVDRAACARCHAVDDVRDPAARCVRGPAVVCFDEHPHRADRYVAWEAAREVALAVGVPARANLAPWGWSGGALAVGALAWMAASRRRKSEKAAPAPPVAPRVRLPVIDAATCLGCSACVDACPFDVLAIERFVAVVARPSECCGVVHCADVCPNGSLRIADGDVIGDRPLLDAHLESTTAPGVFLAGDLTGLPLIRNAIEQGARVADRVADARARRHPDLDLLVVGAGPAGLSALVRARERGLRAACVEQAAFAASIRNFPRGKVVFDVPGQPPLGGALWMGEATKEELIQRWTLAVRSRALDVREHRRVVEFGRDAEGFVVECAREDGERESVRAGCILLAIGRRGTPRALPIDVAPELASKVSYALADARAFAGADVLVVGLGDTAMEAAMGLAHAGARVTVSYRGAGFARGKERNRAALSELAERGRVAIRWETEVIRVGRGTATLRGPRGDETLANDAVLVLIGGTPSWDLVTRAGVRLAAAAEIERAPGP